MAHWLVPGAWVTHPQRPDWGPGQIQSATGSRAVVNFTHAGKQAINLSACALKPAQGGLENNEM